jgi:16S rRNA processing protein RimM
MKALPLSDLFSILSPENKVILMTPSGGREEKIIKTLRKNNASFIISFYGIDSMTEAAKYRNSLLLAEEDILPPLPSGEYFIEDIIGLSVVTTEGDFIGKVSDVFETGSNDVFVVKDISREYLIPAIKDVIKEIDLDKSMIIINSMKGLLD